jgi:TolB protein
MRRSGCKLGLALALALLAPELRAEDRLQIEVEGGRGRDVQLAVQRFDAGRGEPARVIDRFDERLERALTFSGLIQPVDRRAFLEPIETRDYEQEFIPCDNWRGIGADGLVQGRLEWRDGRLVARFRVWDTVRCRMQGDAARLEAVPEEVDLLARRIADEIVRRFTGRRGVAATQIAFVSTRTGNKEVAVMEADGGNPRSVTNNSSINLFPSWSPDGDSLLYTSYRGGQPQVWQISRGARTNGRVGRNGHPELRGVWGPRGAGIALVVGRGGEVDLWRISAGGSRPEQLTNHRSLDTSPSFSPDGSKVAFVSDRSGTPQIYVLDLGSREVTRLTFRGSYNTSPAWSPSGEWIAFQTQTDSSFDLYLIDPESRYTVPLVVYPRSDEEPAWSPDGRKLVFSSSRLGTYQLYAIDLDGENLTRLTEGLGDCTAPAWSPWLD